MPLEYSPQSLKEIIAVLDRHNCNGAIIKALGKNHNDKNQVYVGSDFRPLHPFFEFRFSERVASISKKQGGKHEGVPILEATFEDFRWLGTRGEEIPARNLKMIIYPQYPEARLSGFEPAEGNMPPSMSVEFTKQKPDTRRYLLLARRGLGSALGIMITDPAQQFIRDVDALPATRNSRVWKRLELGSDARTELRYLLSKALGREHFGCRLDKHGDTIPFNGTQVCGFTLEQTLGITPNSSKDGDYKGIELKTHTQKKVTLFTPEPDLGIYNHNFQEFMRRFGYMDINGNYRLTGIHRANIRCEKSGLTLRIDNYDGRQKLVTQTNRDIIVGLYTDDSTLAAGWSLPRILNCWGAKHNETVYVPAGKSNNTRQDMLNSGYKYTVRFDRLVRWCRGTSADKLFRAIEKGTIFLDPAPKFVPTKLADSKRRSQWRVNDIGKAVYDLYDHVEEITLGD